MSFDDDFVDVSGDTKNLDKMAGCCFSFTSEFSLHKAFLFSVPILFTFALLFLFYLFFLRPRRADWSSIRMRNSLQSDFSNDISNTELGLKKEVREMLPIIIYKESFSVRETQCSVCLSDYQAEDKLQQIPACGHTFHMECIDNWLSTHSTCPLCRLSLFSVSTNSSEPPSTQYESPHEGPSNFSSNHEHQAREESQTRGQLSESRVNDERHLHVIPSGTRSSLSRKIEDCESSDRVP